MGYSIPVLTILSSLSSVFSEPRAKRSLSRSVFRNSKFGLVTEFGSCKRTWERSKFASSIIEELWVAASFVHSNMNLDAIGVGVTIWCNFDRILTSLEGGLVGCLGTVGTGKSGGSSGTTGAVLFMLLCPVSHRVSSVYFSLFVARNLATHV